jgi:GrpB-like predicted nucleotidyltransferase (UPF0157 family)
MNIEIADYSPYWKLTYLKEEQRILNVLNLSNISVKIAHIGSTAVPGLSAKPTIDILIGLDGDTLLDDCFPGFRKLRYIYVSKYNDILPFRRFFIKIQAVNPLQKFDKKEVGPADSMPLRSLHKHNFHIHVVHRNTLFYEKHIAFRNHLRTNEGDRLAYQNLKLHLAAMNWEDENDYAQAKSAFIIGVMAKLGFI